MNCLIARKPTRYHSYGGQKVSWIAAVEVAINRAYQLEIHLNARGPRGFALV